MRKILLTTILALVSVSVFADSTTIVTDGTHVVTGSLTTSTSQYGAQAGSAFDTALPVRIQ